VGEHLTHRGTGPGGDSGSGQRPEGPAHGRGADGDDGRLHAGEERELPPSSPEPGKPAACGLRVAAHADRGQDRKGEEEGRGLAADQEKTPSGDIARLAGGAQLLDWCSELERARRRLELRACAGRVALEAVDLPGANRPGLQRRHPGVAAVDGFELGRGGEPGDSFRQDERGWLRPVVPRGVLELRAQGRAAPLVLNRGDEVAEQDRRGDDCCSDLDEAEPRDVRNASGPA
jgi:hypothetical protein